MAKYEGSKADKAEDRRGAKSRGLTLPNFEQSPEDERQDRMHQRALNAKGGAQRGPGRPPMPPYEQSPAREKAGRMAGRKAAAATMPPMGEPDADDLGIG